MDTKQRRIRHYCKILDVDVPAKDVVRKAYLRLSLLYHPDRNSTPDATARFQQIHEAYEFLSQLHEEEPVAPTFDWILKNSLHALLARIFHTTEKDGHVHQTVEVDLRDVFLRNYMQIEINRYRPHVDTKSFTVPCFFADYELAGEGDQFGDGETKYGNLHLHFHVKPHEHFHIDRGILVLSVAMNSLEMYIGTRRFYTHLSGQSMRIEIKPFFFQRYQPVFYFPHLGLWNEDKGGHDDLEIRVQLQEQLRFSWEEDFIKKMSAEYYLLLHGNVAIEEAELEFFI